MRFCGFEGEGVVGEVLSISESVVDEVPKLQQSYPLLGQETRFLMLHISNFNVTHFDFKVTHSV